MHSEFNNRTTETTVELFANLLKKITWKSFGIILLTLYCIVEKGSFSCIFSSLFRLLFGTLYPAYASYKAVKTKNLKEYVKWMMYWIVFALFTCTETFTDVFLSWFPFYYEIKIILVIWLLSPATRGSSILYRKFVHPMLSSKEQEIDEYLLKAKEQSYKQVLDLGSKGVNVLMQTALKGGGGIVNQLRKSYSLSDLTGPSDSQIRDEQSETDGLSELKSNRKKRALAASTSSNLYFAEVDVRQDISHIKSTEDISSGYSSGEVSKLQSREGLVRSGSMVSTRSKSVKMTRSTVVPKRSSALTDSDECDYESQEDDDDADSSLSDQVLPTANITENDDETSKVICTLANNEIACLMPPQNVENKIGPLYKSKSVGSLNIAMVESVANTKKVNQRGGKYKKRAAPLPPKTTEVKKYLGDLTDETVSTIRATLVLKPGHTTSSERNKSKSLPLKNKNQTPTRFKEGSPFTRFLTMSKKLSFWNREEQDANDLKMVSDLKRSSLLAELPNSAHLLLVNSKSLSKSADNFQFRDSNRCTKSEH